MIDEWFCRAPGCNSGYSGEHRKDMRCDKCRRKKDLIDDLRWADDERLPELARRALVYLVENI